MRALVFGSKDWIGEQFCRNSTHTIIPSTTHPENYEDCLGEIQRTRPDCVISFLDRTNGIDYLEDKLNENMRDNFYAPYNLASICEKLNIQFVYLGTGCIYDGGKFTEEDKPNFFGSGYSIVKGYTDKVLRNFKNTLQLRIRMPISKLESSYNLIDKLVSYPNIYSVANSMTVLDDMWPIIDKMIDVKEVGVYNFCNIGTVDHKWILEQYKSRCDPTHTWNLVSHPNTKHSNNELDTTKLERFCDKYGLYLWSIKESIIMCLRYRALSEAVT